MAALPAGGPALGLPVAPNPAGAAGARASGPDDAGTGAADDGFAGVLAGLVTELLPGGAEADGVAARLPDGLAEAGADPALGALVDPAAVAGALERLVARGGPAADQLRAALAGTGALEAALAGDGGPAMALLLRRPLPAELAASVRAALAEVTDGVEGAGAEGLAGDALMETERTIDTSRMEIGPPTRFDALLAQRTASSGGEPVAPPPTGPLTPREADFAPQLAERLRWQTRAGQETAELRLDPPDLGALRVRIRMDGDEATVVFSAGQAQVREAVEAALPRLRDLLGEAGIQLASVDVESGRSGAEEGTARRETGAGQGGGSGRDGDGDEAPVGARPTAGRGLIDAYV